MNMIKTIIQDNRMASALARNKSLFKKKTVRDFLSVMGAELALRSIQPFKEFVVT